MTNALIFGNGFIGSRLSQETGYSVFPGRVYSYKDIDAAAKKYSADVLINCIGSTGIRNTDDCEKNIEETLLLNSFLPQFFAEYAIRNNKKLVQISSGCIYDFKDGDEPIVEERKPDFFGLFYSRSKIYEEYVLGPLSEHFNILILRMRIPLDCKPHPKNLLTKLLGFKQILDTENSVSYIPDFALALQYLIGIDARGIYNLTNKGTLRYPQLLDAYKRYDPDFTYETVSKDQLGLVRTNLELSVRKVEKTGFYMRNITDALDECTSQYVSNLKGN